MNEPITSRVMKRKSKNFPINQEVTKNADGTGGPISIAKKKDACYRKVKARYDVFPSAYASGAIAACRKKGAANWGNSSPSKQTTTPPPGFTDKLYEKGEVIKDKMKNLEKEAFIRSNYSSENYEESKGEKKAQRKLKRLGKKLTRVEKREKKKRKKYNY